MDGSRPTSLALVGDTSMGDRYLDRPDAPELADAFHRLEHDPWSFVESVAPLVDDTSLLVANLETVLAVRPADPFGGKKRYQGWDLPDRTLAILQRLGVDAVSLANNHSMDFGAAPLLATIAHLEAAGIVPIGAGAHEAAAARPLTLAAPFGNLHIFAGYEVRRSYARKWGFYASSGAPGVNALSHGANTPVSDAVARTRAADPGSVIIVCPHWSGPQNYQWATDEMVTLNEEFLSAGGDLGVGPRRPRCRGECRARREPRCSPWGTSSSTRLVATPSSTRRRSVWWPGWTWSGRAAG